MVHFNSGHLQSKANHVEYNSHDELEILQTILFNNGATKT